MTAASAAGVLGSVKLPLELCRVINQTELQVGRHVLAVTSAVSIKRPVRCSAQSLTPAIMPTAAVSAL